MPYAHPEALVTADWLAQHLEDGNVIILDASYKQPGVSPTAREDYEAEHIMGAGFFDIDDVAAPDTGPLPHMIPSLERFAEKMSYYGIDNPYRGGQTRVVVYDTHGLSSAARAWWLLRLYGHDNVAVLDGGFPKWKTEGHPVVDWGFGTLYGYFVPRFRPELLRDKATVLANIDTRQEQLVDARSAGRFDGSAEETWPGRRRGHIPGSRNLPFDQVTDPVTRQMKSAERLRALFDAAGVTFDRPVVASCGSGVTACALAFAAYLIGHENVAVYDGSWSEWGLPDGPPIETGPAR
jgi:thiosulfate/3-mercaptopyruvate sulfurtransferase